MAEKETTNSSKSGGDIPRGPKKQAVGGAKLSPKFNPMYIYGVLVIAFIAIQYFTSSGSPIETSWQEVKNTMLKKWRY